MTASDLERARDFADFLRSNHCISAHDKPATMTGAVYGGSINEQGLQEIAKLISEVRNETLDRVYRTMEHRARWASKNHPESAYIGACRDTLKALDTMKNTDKEGEK